MNYTNTEHCRPYTFLFKKIFDIDNLTNEIFDLLSDSKQRKFIIKKFTNGWFSNNELKNIFEL